jgi:hypothetical protein
LKAGRLRQRVQTHQVWYHDLPGLSRCWRACQTVLAGHGGRGNLGTPGSRAIILRAVHFGKTSWPILHFATCSRTCVLTALFLCFRWPCSPGRVHEAFKISIPILICDFPSSPSLHPTSPTTDLALSLHVSPFKLSSSCPLNDLNDRQPTLAHK